MDIATLETHRHHVTAPSGPISFLDVGQGRTAVFIHGVITNSMLWRHVVGAVASEQRRCIAVDLPGHGHTPPATRDADVSLAGLAQRVIDLCDHLNLQQVDLVANDTGGAVAQIAAARLGDRLTTLTLTNCDTEPNMPPRMFKPVVAAARWPRIFEVLGPWLVSHPAVMRWVSVAGYQNAHHLPPDVLDAFWRPVLGTRTAAAAFAHLLASLNTDDLTAVRPQLQQLRAPTLIVWGTGDIFFSIKWAHQLADLIPSTTQVATIAGARLFFPDERADELIPLLEQHWQQFPGSTAS
ncbi:alpha/beta fold hydrolase [Mycobacterium helveticum]|uniref:Alpha/beta hydrolase n=1 Tax=Mycobacterium helveticum TaxID=2592811 RepID=A0A557Y007_9MYCO|nr:alpha/beta hydrolase [Mycobacterium helveticum]TVS87795.1 alpha/beta hydrolase [Mycobacterium helveticum]TVS91816.1 alpha/beta hydrolase [Mycobacterium helveticum]